MKVTSSSLLFVFLALFNGSYSYAADEDGRCLRAAERHCAAILDTFGEARYRECVSRRIQSCLGGARGQVFSSSFTAHEAVLEADEVTQQEL